ncbi:MAG TPA: endonuclease/exonuclease/phosphatase family protein [Phototrophicaceae bacterium]|nr:endonuclease/exonuclease/phosphatase family protein [Phototrophicaceae bacterium]
MILLQEITPEYARETLAHLTEVYPYHSGYPETRHWAASMVLSRYPIVSQAELDAPGAETPTLMRLVLDVDGQKIAVYNLQLAWPVRSRPRLLPVENYYLKVILGYDDRLRNCQIDYLLNQFQDEPYPFIAAGDFNTSAASPTYRQLANHLHDSFREVGRGWGGSWPVSTARGLPSFLPPLLRLDYIWHSDHFRAIQAQVGQPVGSDHRPLLAVLELLAD